MFDAAHFVYGNMYLWKKADVTVYFALLFCYLVLNDIMVTTLFLQELFTKSEKRYDYLSWIIREDCSSMNPNEYYWKVQQLNRSYFLLILVKKFF